MKIAQISATFPPYMAGTGNVCYNYAIELAKLGHKVTVLTSKFDRENYAYPEIIEVKRFNPLFKFGNAPFLPQLLFQERFDIIHLHYPFFGGSEFVYLLSRLKEQKYILTYHNDVILSNFLGAYVNLYNRLITPLIMNKSSGIIISTLDYKNFSCLRRLFEDNIDKLWELPLGTDISRFNPSVQCNGLKSKYNLFDRKIILFVGALDSAHYFKGLDCLLKSFSKLNNPEFKLLVVGEGNLKSYYINLSKRLGISDNTIFVGSVSDIALPKFYAASDLVVLPSTNAGESFGLVLIEAMATGKPVIASNLPGVRKVINNGINGMLTQAKNIDDLASKIAYLLDNDDVRKNFGLNGRMKVEDEYDWTKITKKLENIYSKVLRD